MQISPAVPAGTGFSCSSTTMIRARPTGLPTGTTTAGDGAAGSALGSPARTSNRVEVMVVSVSPYALSNRAQGAARSAVRQTSGSAGAAAGDHQPDAAQPLVGRLGQRQQRRQ